MQLLAKCTGYLGYLFYNLALHVSRYAGTRGVLGDGKPPHFCLECRCRACANPTSDPACRLFPSHVQVLPVVYRPPVLRLFCADGTSSAPLTLPIMSLHSQMVHGEDTRNMPHPLGKPSLWRVSGYWRYSAATLDGIMVADRAREQWLPSIGTRKRAYRFEGLRPVGVPLRFLLSRLLMLMKKATDRFMRDTIRCCYGAQGFLLLHHTMHDQRPMFCGNTIFGMSWPWSPFANYRRGADVMCFVVSEHVLDLEIQFSRRLKEEI